ncbi:MAG: PKD domain-containing protein, partial [Actinobacteria bacterium]|nr:PKD domain-containing protein [Actinomycetota bacterium]
DLRMQRAAEKAVADALDQPDDPSAALVAINPVTGEILAMVGGRDFETQQFNVAVQGKRQPGSAFKPFVLTSALDQGVLPEQTFPAGPTSFALKNGQTWTVTGASGGNTGQIRLREATEKSVNSVFAKLILDTDPKMTVKMAEKLGIHMGVEPVPAIALGGLEHGVSPLEMASAYGTLAAGGKHTVPYGIGEVLDAKGDSVFSAETSATQAIDPALAYLTTDILRGVISKGTGTAAKIGRPAAGKTGTTQEYRDAWFVGYTPQLVCAVWVGYPDTQREMKSVHGRKVTGGSFPAEIWAQFMKSALASAPELEFIRPSKGITTIKVCADSGGAATDFCPTTFSGQFLTKETPESCSLHALPTKITIPNVVGMTKDAALAALKKLMLLFKVIEEDVPGVAAGLVAKQSPDAASEGTTQTVVTITVSNGGAGNTPPRAEFTMSPTQASVGQSVDFDATASSDDGKIVMYYWEFGDSSEGKGKKTSHAFTLPGTYDVTLWVTDDKDQTSSISRAVTVH